MEYNRIENNGFDVNDLFSLQHHHKIINYIEIFRNLYEILTLINNEPSEFDPIFFLRKLRIEIAKFSSRTDEMTGTGTKIMKLAHFFNETD